MFLVNPEIVENIKAIHRYRKPAIEDNVGGFRVMPNVKFCSSSYVPTRSGTTHQHYSFELLSGFGKSGDKKRNVCKRPNWHQSHLVFGTLN